MKIDPSVQKSQYLPLQSKTDPISTSQDLNLNGEAQPDQSQQAEQESSLGTDQAQVSTPKAQHGTEPTQVHFETASPQQETPAPSAMRIQDWETPSDTTETQQAMDFAREIQNQNIQSLLDGIDQSLARAQKMMQENQQHYYTKVKPQMDALKKALSEEKAGEAAAATSDQRAAKSQLSHMIGEVKNQLSAVMQTNPELAQTLEKALAQAQLLSEMRAH
jgi:mevalonate kinase